MAYSSEKFTDQLLKVWPILLVVGTFAVSGISWGFSVQSNVSTLKSKINTYQDWNINLKKEVFQKVAESKLEISEKLDDVKGVQTDVNELNIKTEVLGEQLEAVKESQKRTEEDVKETRKDIEKTKEKVDETNDLLRELIQQQAAPAPMPAPMPAPRPRYDYQYDYPQQPAPRPQYIPRQQYYY